MNSLAPSTNVFGNDNIIVQAIDAAVWGSISNAEPLSCR